MRTSTFRKTVYLKLLLIFLSLEINGQSTEFQYTGNIQTYIVPATGTYKLETWGAQGGSVTTYFPTQGALGGYASGTMSLTLGQTIYIYVGGKGEDRLGNHPYPVCTFVPGGWNGGGGTRSAGNSTPGGGASDIRINGNDLIHRVLVAGGGGGSGWNNAMGGVGGGLAGADGEGTWWDFYAIGSGRGRGGTQLAGGAPGISPQNFGCTPAGGSLGQGGVGSGYSAGGGGGGGGYYGGGGGHVDGGGGGSSYIGGVTSGTTVPGVREGNGLVIITPVNAISTTFSIASVCSGSTTSVSFTASGTFNMGNVFIAQLSDASGSFAAPVTIGTVSGTASGTINATIPANISAGSGYRIRVVSSDPAVIGTDNGSNITINSLPTAVLSGGGTICPSGSANLSVALTGTGPWSVTYTDGTTPVTVSSITASPHTIPVSPGSTKTYSLVSVTDANCNATSLSGTATVTVNSVPELTVPSIASVGNDANICGASVSFAATATGAPTPSITYKIGSTIITSPHIFPVGTTTVTATATNSCGSDIETFNVTVTNDLPVINTFAPAHVDPVLINSSISFNGTYTDNNLASAEINWGDGPSSAAGVVIDNNAKTIASSHTYTATGVYTVQLNVADKCDETDSEIYQYVVVYDPSGGFVTGGGWFTSPPGAHKINTTATGKANFGFVSKYQKGAKLPSGDTNFEFKAADLHFKSTNYEWLVVSGATARYKGVGTINGTGNYGFILAATDGQVTGGGGSDKFRIKIWDKNNSDQVVYDNNLNESDDALAEMTIEGGSIVVHEAKKASSGKAIVSATELEGTSFYSYPTAFSDKTTIAFTLDRAEDYVLEVFDMKGALVKRLSAGAAEANKLYEIELDGTGMREGVYITRLTTASNVRSLKTVLKR